MSDSDALELAFNADGLIPAVVQESSTGRVLMLAWMNHESLRRTMAEGRTVFWSRSRQEYWRKGDTSGHIQRVRRIEHDCDADVLLVTVEQTGAACHTGTHSCFDGRTLWVSDQVQKAATADE